MRELNMIFHILSIGLTGSRYVFPYYREVFLFSFYKYSVMPSGNFFLVPATRFPLAGTQ